MKQFASFLFLRFSTILFAVYSIKPALSSGFSYDVNDTQNGPSNWPGDCQVGLSQSPINIEVDSTQFLGLETFYLNEEYLNGMTNPRIQNTGHTVQLIPSSSNMTMRMNLENETTTLIFAQMHFHWPSEHHINSKQYEVECHCIHYQSEFDNITHAISSEKTNALVIMSILFEVPPTNGSSGNDNTFIKPLTDNLAPVIEPTENSAEVLGNFDLWGLISSGHESFEAYTYKGSLTTPDCNENMKWIVLKHPQHLSENQWNKFKSVKNEHGEYMIGNFRPLQKLHDRQVDQIRITR